MRTWQRNIGASTLGHLLLFLIIGLLLPLRLPDESAAVSLNITLGTVATASGAGGRPAERSQPEVVRTPETQTPPRRVETPTPSRPTPEAQAEHPPETPTPQDAEVPPTTTPTAAPSAPVARPENPAQPWSLEGLDDLDVADQSPGNRESTSFALPGGQGSLELEGTAAGFRANPSQPHLRGFSNAYGQVEINFTVRDTLLQVGDIRFLSGTLTALPPSEAQRLREELRRWLLAWSLPDARDGSQGRVRVALVAPD